MDKNDTNLRRTIRRDELRQMVPLSDSTIYEMERRGEFPSRFALTPRVVVWDLQEVNDWLENRRKQPIARSAKPNVNLRHYRPVKGLGQPRT